MSSIGSVSDAEMLRVGNVEGCLLEDGTLYYRMVNLSHATLAITDATRALRETLLGNAQDIRVIVDASGLLTIDRKLRRFKPYPHVRQMAFVADTAVGRWVVKAYLAFARLPYPTRVFNNLDDATVWVSSH